MFVIPFIPPLDSSNPVLVSDLLNQIPYHPVGHVNWPADFPACPRVSFRMAHNGKELFIRFTVEENSTLARITEDNGEVWTDSCVEFFIALDDSGYYNFEFSCIGKALLGFRKERSAAQHAPSAVMQSIKRFPSLGSDNFEEKQTGEPWELTVAIPATALFRHRITSWENLRAAINVYKCGDHLSEPHYLSWQPIDTEKPDFHVPRCFAPVLFAK